MPSWFADMVSIVASSLQAHRQASKQTSSWEDHANLDVAFNLSQPDDGHGFQGYPGQGDGELISSYKDHIGGGI